MFVKRNQAGQIQALSNLVEPGFEAIDAHSPEFLEFVRSLHGESLTNLEQTDLAMARVMEDLVNLLIDKGLICFTDMPVAAQQKLLARKELRTQFTAINLLDDGDDIKL